MTKMFGAGLVWSVIGVASGCSAALAREPVNFLNDSLLKAPLKEQKEILEEAVGERCKAKRVFYNGIGRAGISRGRAFWSVECKDGRQFMVMIPPNVDGVRVISCADLRKLGIGNCFKRMD